MIDKERSSRVCTGIRYGSRVIRKEQMTAGSNGRGRDSDSEQLLQEVVQELEGDD
jgi:hypothetical protein